MNKSILFFFLLLLSCTQINKEVSILSIATALNQEMETSFRSGDMRKLSSFYGEDAHMISSGRNPIRGRGVIEKYWNRFQNPIDRNLEIILVNKNEVDLYSTDFWKQLKEQPIHWNKFDIQVADTDIVFYQMGHSTLEYESDDGIYQTKEQDFILIWKKYPDGKYRIFVETSILN